MVENINNIVASNLIQIIKEKKLATGELAVVMNVSPLTIKRLLSREIEDFKLSYLWNFCVHYNIPLNKIISINDKANHQTIMTSLQSYQEFMQYDDSMSPTIQYGDKIYIDINYEKFKPYLYLIEDYNGLKIRRLAKDKQGNLIVKADNEKYETVTYTEEEQKEYIEIKGIVMYRITNFF